MEFKMRFWVWVLTQTHIQFSTDPIAISSIKKGYPFRPVDLTAPIKSEQKRRLTWIAGITRTAIGAGIANLMHLILTAHKVIVVNVIATGIVARDKLIAVDCLCTVAGGVAGDLGVLGEREQVIDQAVGGLRAQGSARGVDEGAHELGRDQRWVIAIQKKINYQLHYQLLLY